ncbi:unnamed protein product, partial [Arabidopsis halleri]
SHDFSLFLSRFRRRKKRETPNLFLIFDLPHSSLTCVSCNSILILNFQSPRSIRRKLSNRLEP